MDDETGGATNHAHKVRTLSVDDYSVHLSPQMKQGLARIAAAVQDSKDFDPDIRANLEELAGGKPFLTVRNALSGIAWITKETMRHINATGDQTAQSALSNFIEQFYEENEKGTPSFTLVHRVPGKAL
jgi:hypothetical protein